MSTSYDVKCKTCGVATALDLNHGGHALMNALSHRRALEEFGRTLVAIRNGRDGWYFDDVSRTGRMEILCEFLAAHEGHALVVFDEYGRDFDSCAADVICTCGASHYCTLRPGHDGPHVHAK